MKHLILVRGVPGSGKTTVTGLFDRIPLLPNADGDYMIAADDFMIDDDGNYEYNPKRLAECHKKCQDAVKHALMNYMTVVVHNTFCAEWEMDAYYKIAEEIDDCKVHTIIVENRHGSKSVHDVPADKIQMMKDKFTEQDENGNLKNIIL